MSTRAYIFSLIAMFGSYRIFTVFFLFGIDFVVAFDYNILNSFSSSSSLICCCLFSVYIMMLFYLRCFHHHLRHKQSNTQHIFNLHSAILIKCRWIKLIEIFFLIEICIDQEALTFIPHTFTETNAQDNISIIFIYFFFVIQLQKQQTAAAAAAPTATTTKHKTSKIDTTKSNEILWLL